MADPKPTDDALAEAERLRRAAAREDEPAAQAGLMHQRQLDREAEDEAGEDDA